MICSPWFHVKDLQKSPPHSPKDLRRPQLTLTEFFSDEETRESVRLQYALDVLCTYLRVLLLTCSLVCQIVDEFADDSSEVFEPNEEELRSSSEEEGLCREEDPKADKKKKKRQAQAERETEKRQTRSRKAATEDRDEGGRASRG